MSMEPHIELIARITAGEVDDHFNEINEAISNRKSVLNRKKKSFLSPGDEVTFAKSINPKYLAGGTAEVVKVLQKNVSIKILTVPGRDASSRDRFRVGQVIRCPISVLEVNDPNEEARRIVEAYENGQIP